MIVHVACFKFRNATDIEPIAVRLEALRDTIPEIRGLEVGRAVVSSERAYDLAVISEFDSLDDLTAYRQHPDHVAVGRLIAEATERVAVVDFAR
jgi:hypothetical protein